MIIDESGSMSDVKKETIDGINVFIKENKDIKTYFSLLTFDDKIKVHYSNKPSSDVSEFESFDYNPCGCTALCDAWVKEMKHISAQIIEDLAEHGKTQTIQHIVVVLTDGEENSSVKYAKKDVKKYVEILKKMDVKFIFMGSHEGAIKDSHDYSIDEDNAIKFEGSQTPSLFKCVSANVRSGSYRFSDEDREICSQMY